MKKFLSLFLSLLMLFSITSVSFSALAGSDDFWYTELSDGTIRLWSCRATTADVEVPETIDGKTVSTIDSDTFYNISTLINVSIPKTVTTIASNAFVICSNLENINVDENNPNYSSINGVLFDKSKITLLQYATGNPRTEYTVPSGTKTLGAEAFKYAEKLEKLIISSTVTTFNNSFIGTTKLSCFEVDSNSKYFSAKDGILFDKSQTQLYRFPIGSALTEYTIPETVTDIRTSAFAYCENLKAVNIPSNVKTIWASAFLDCIGLTEIDVPGSVTYLYGYVFKGCRNIKKLTLNEGISSIGTQCFLGCLGLTTLTLPKSLTYIYTLAFSSCDNITSVRVLNSNTEFADCKGALPANAVVYSYSNSNAKSYARTWDRTFVQLDKYDADAMGGSIRLNNAGLRFGFKFDNSQAQNVEEYGFVYAYGKTDDLYVDSYGVKTLVANNKIEDGNITTFNLVFTNVPKASYDQIISARAYVKIDGAYFYSDVLQRSFRGVANAVIADSTVDISIKETINNMLEG